MQVTPCSLQRTRLHTLWAKPPIYEPVKIQRIFESLLGNFNLLVRTTLFQEKGCIIFLNYKDII